MTGNGYAALAPGKIAAVVTYLEMHAPPPWAGASPGDGADWSLERLNGDLPRYRRLYTEVGEPWLWFSRLVMPESGLKAILDDPGVDAFALQDGAGRDIGLLELDFREPGACELTFFGLVPSAVGAGWGRILMGEALRRAWTKPIGRLWLHTCTLDHPRAMGFYIRSGFTPYKRAIEVADDPRLSGRLPRSAAPHAPVIDSR